MAGEELNRPPSLPPYAEMIFSAIDALKEKDGSSTSSISNYIESTCGSLPEEHTNILADQLNKLVENGELVVSNNNYMRPDSATPAKRGRGRPPKAKDPSAAETETPAAVTSPATAGSEVKRGRGRPKKDPNAPPSAKKVKAATVPTPPSKTGRPRGRPRKVQPEPAGVEAN
ncbi:putative High mobility group protein HMGA, plant [Helianthus annuus]|uniref:High mobility group protein HMGA n=1 Tax=Helianthus annuus TaxID=4232 RepID=A0A251SJ93_HELAN|nr:HMG-Y-related protein A [Helianthus annuus]KAF5769313.1 putative High mobility group protein HMGA [Helianthus annuus]KAJ0464373.1 putative linker histone H1/H5, domain H15, AT hook, DNA-binding protein [Helianthus annuus]KAJ0468866.1 putative High mobility group protein HMGA, plant [Helianthus annuus]KAJ0485941.1 putative linker histone H1/H5, domain H15, AT hook, DNA-binding protein [Helianthus annuus]KAJ0656494.1 putative linker histone H1/H5, domain H15, AT hook, DNA-binding protein [Hel